MLFAFHDLHYIELILTLSSSLLTVGLLIGPRGNTLKKMETESGAKIAIRGKGSVKEGKGRSDAAHTSNQEEDLHCLIMADTEDKVNKAKKLIHNIIETVRTPSLYLAFKITNVSRLLPSPKVRMSSNVTSFVNLPPSTVPSETTRTKLARTAAKSVIASTIALNSATSPRTSSVASVAMLGTWLATVQTDSVAQTGATMTAVHLASVASAEAMQSTANTSPSCKSCLVAVLSLVVNNSASKLVQAAMTTVITAMAAETMPSRGSVLRPAVPLHGRRTVVVEMAAAAAVPQHHGQRVVSRAMAAMTTMEATDKARATVNSLPLRHHGRSQLRAARTTVAMAAMASSSMVVMAHRDRARLVVATVCQACRRLLLASQRSRHLHHLATSHHLL